MYNSNKVEGLMMNKDIRFIHFTTSDLNNFLDKKFNMDLLSDLLVGKKLKILVNRYHMLEWLAVEEYTRHTRLMAIKHYANSFAFCGQTFEQILSTKKISVTDNAFLGAASLLYNLKESCLSEYNFVLNSDLILEKNILVSQSEGDFFARMALLTEMNKLNAFDDGFLKKFKKINLKHGVNIERAWSRGKRFVQFLEQFSFLRHWGFSQSNKKIIYKYQKIYKKKLYNFEMNSFAKLYAVEVDDVLFQLYWRIRDVLKNDPSEVGGLSELVDIRELAYLPFVVLLSADKRMEPKIKNILRDDSIFPSDFERRVIRCGNFEKIIESISTLA